MIDRDERRQRARENGTAPSTTTITTTRCACCYGPVEPGEVVCSPECDEIWFGVVPLADGELWSPPQRPPQGRQQAGP